MVVFWKAKGFLKKTKRTELEMKEKKIKASETKSDLTTINLVSKVCLDGSPPGYHLHKGSGAGAQNWLLQFEVKIKKIPS